MKINNKKIVLLLIVMFVFQLLSINNAFAVIANCDDVSAELNVGSIYEGFRVKSKEYIEDIDSTVYKFEHEKTGAQMCYVKNNDKYKVFSVNIRTLADDNTGVNHILEHVIALMCKKVHGDTSANVTRYSFATYNEDEFQTHIKNMMEGIFLAGDIDKNLIKQEGWRYEIDEPDGELKINGIVYNEEKGIQSPFTILDKDVQLSLYPNLNNFDYGGTVEDIPKLTYEKIMQTYKKYYTPSNSLLYLYGDLDINVILKTINEDYFNKFNRSSPINVLSKDEYSCNNMNVYKDYYSVNTDESTDNATYLAVNYLLGENLDYDTKKSFEILQQMLSPKLEKCFDDNDLGCPVWININPFSIVAQGANESQKDKFLDVVNKTLNDIVKNGFDNDTVLSTLNSYEINSNEDSSAVERGKKYIKNIAEIWSESGDIEEDIFTCNISSIRNKYNSDNKYFEHLIEKYLLNNQHSSLVVLEPKQGLEDENEKKLAASLEEYKQNLSSDQINNLINENKEFKIWQNNNSNSNNQSVNLNSVNKQAEQIPSEESDYKNAKILKHNINTNDMQYINLYFDTSKVPQDKLMNLVLLSKILSKIDTKNYTNEQLINKINMYTGGIEFNIYQPDSMICDKNADGSFDKLKVSISTLNSNLQDSFNILQEVILNSSFDDKAKIKNLIKHIKSEMEGDMNDSIYSFVLDESLAYSNDGFKYGNITGIPFYKFICDLDKDYDVKYDELLNSLNELKDLVFNNKLIISYTGNDKGYEKFNKCFNEFYDNLKEADNINKQEYSFNYPFNRQAFIIPKQIQCIIKSGDYRSCGYECSGKIMVLKTILNNYLKNQIRIKGGAYSGGVDKFGSCICFYSDKDSNLKETIDEFNSAASYLENFNVNEDQMNKYILKSLQYIDTPLEASSKGSRGDDIYIMGITQEDIQKYRDEIYTTTQQDIRNYAPMIRQLMDQNNLCVAGNENVINVNKDLFQNIDTLRN